MTMVAPGYLRPQQNAPLDAREDAAIAAICPGLRQTVVAGGRTNHVLWGPYIAMMTGFAMDPDLRHAGASGGALSAILAHLIDSGTVDAVIQITADTDVPISNVTVVSTKTASIKASAGSRYVASAPMAGLDKRLAEHAATGRRFAIVGKPCDAAALREMCNADPRLEEAFPVIVSFFCAGVPSLTGVEKILTELGTDLDNTASFRFRGNGWPGRATAVAHDGTERSMSYQDSWGKILSKHVQHRCKICADGTGVAADIVCADAWESDAAGYPVFAEADGISLIVARTSLGADLIAGAQQAGRLKTAPFDITTLVAIQPGQRERRRALLARLVALQLLGLPVPRYRGLRIAAAARQNPLARNIKNFIGTLRRGLRRGT